jgi:peptide deformylase
MNLQQQQSAMTAEQSPPTTIEARPIKLLGDPTLRFVSAPVRDFSSRAFLENWRSLQATLADFRRRHGFGRAVSAPQIGIHQRFIALNLGNLAPRLLVNPEITRASREKFTMWDDCMSFPGLLVRLERHRSISVRFQNESGDRCEWNDLDIAAAELLQHEMDHLDGVLAIDRAIDRDSVIMREVYEANREAFAARVDYVIY